MGQKTGQKPEMSLEDHQKARKRWEDATAYARQIVQREIPVKWGAQDASDDIEMGEGPAEFLERKRRESKEEEKEKQKEEETTKGNEGDSKEA